MNYTTYIQNLFYSFLQRTDNVNGKLMFIKHDNKLQLNLEDIESLTGEEYKEGVLYHRFSKNDIKEPYEPFMNGIRYYYRKLFSKKMSVEEFVDKSEVYSLHKDIFISYMATGYAKRNEPMIVAESAYELKKFANSIINCYNYIAKSTNVLLILDRFHFAGLATIRLVRMLVENVDLCNIKLMIIYNERNQSLGYVDKAFEDIVSIADEKSILFEWEDNDEIIMNDYHSSFIPDRRYFEEYIRKINNLYYMLAIDDAQYYIDVIHNRIVEDKVNIDRADQFELYIYASMCYIFKNDLNGAMLMSERLASLYDRNSDLLSDYRYNHICGQIQMSLVQSDLTQRYATKCIEIANQLGDDRLLFQAEVLCQASQFGGWKDMFAVDFDSVTIQEEMIERFKKYKYLNTLAYYLVFGNDNDAETVKNMAEGNMSRTDKDAIRIGKELGNNCFLLTAYTKCIILFTENGYHKSALKFYEEKFKLLIEENDERRKAHLLMGMGYSSIVGEEYGKANSSFIEAVEILYRLRNPEEIAEALYNMAENCICAGDYQKAIEYLSVVFKILDNLNMETIQICNKSKLYGLLALAYYEIGNEYRCYKALNNIELILSHFIEAGDDKRIEYSKWYEDLFLYHMLTAILEKNSGAYENAKENFKQADFYFRNCISTAFYGITTFVIEYYDYFLKTDKPDEAFKILDFGLRYCNENGYTIKAKRLVMLSENKKIVLNTLPADFGNIEIEEIVELSYNIGKEGQLYDAKKDIRFLSIWQEMLNRDDLQYQEIISNAMTALQKNFIFDEILYFDVDKKKIDIIYRDIDIKDENNLKNIVDFFKVTKREFIANRNAKTFSEYDKVTSVFDKNKIFTLVGVPVYTGNSISSIFIGILKMHRNFRHNKIIMDEDRLMIMKTAIVQLNTGIERVKNKQKIVEINEKLNELAVTDMLTGLYNRQGLAKLLEQFSNLSSTVAILYADLDNFKYYNDTFGHDVGDVILKEFSRVISEIAKNIGYAVRYGGDEFLVVLNNVDADKAKEVAVKIYEAMSDGFVPIVRQYIKQEVEVPKDKLVSCSIGIALSENGSADNIDEAMKNADKALYYMKRGTKGNYILWDDINEEVD